MKRKILKYWFEVHRRLGNKTTETQSRTEKKRKTENWGLEKGVAEIKHFIAQLRSKKNNTETKAYPK